MIFLLPVARSFAQTGVTRIYTDYNGYWTSASTAINTVKPDNSHNLLGFVWNGVTYSTGVNNALLTSKGVSFSATTYQAFPVKNILLPGTSSNFVGLGQLYDGVDNGGSTSSPFTVPADISRLLTDGVNGLDLGMCVTNIPTSSSALTFTFSSVTNNAALIGDGTPDILISQVAQPDNTYDQVYFEDKNGALVGTIVSINESTTAVPSVGNWTADFYNPNTGVIAPGFIKTDRPIRIWAADASLFGLTASNYKNAVVLRYKLGGTSDPAFLAFNTAFIQLVSANDDAAVTDVGSPVSISVVANDQPTGGLNPASLMVTSAPAHGAVTINTTTGVATYSPSAGFSGTDTFKYQICNAAGQCDDALVTIMVGNADLAVVTTVSSSTPAKGNNVNFVIKATNNGPNEATGVVVRDVLPNGYTFVSASTNQYSSNTGNWTIGSLANTATTSLTITATVNESGIYSTTATIGGTKQDLVDNNNASTVATTPVSVSDRSVTKVASSTAPVVGSVVSFTVMAINNGPSAATSVRVTDGLGPGYSFQSATASMGTYNSSTGLWTIGTMAKNGMATLVISATVNSTGSYANTATISGTETDPVTGNNTVTITPIPVLQADLALTQNVDKPTPDVGTNVVFTLVATNNGPSPASGVNVQESLSSGYSLVSASATTGSYSAGSGQWTIGSLSSGQSVTLTITATVNTTGSYTSSATISGAETDLNNTNNTATAAPVPVPKADLSVVKTVNTSTSDVGTNVVFTVIATNNGPSPATGVTVGESLPSGYRLVSTTATAGSYSAGSAQWSIGSLSNGQSVTLMVTATVNAMGDYANTATIRGTEADPVSANNTSTASTTPVAQTDLAITQNVDSLTPNVGQTVTFTVVATNNGPSPATGVNVQESLPSGYSLVSASTTTGSYSDGVWSIGSLSSSQRATLTITARINPTGPYATSAVIKGNEADPVSANNTAPASITPVAQTDLAITQRVDNLKPGVGQTVSFTLVATNNGPSEATGVTVQDSLPSGYSLVSASATVGSYRGGIWSIGALTGTQSVTLSITAVVNASGSYANSATISGLQTDPTTSNNTFTISPAPVAQADLALLKSVNEPIPAIGQTVEFTLVATNNGPSPATGVNVQESLPSGYSFVSATASEGSYGAGSGQWRIGSLSNGQSTTLIIAATVNATGGYANTAIIRGNETDPVSANDTSIVSTTPIVQTDLVITQNVDNLTPRVGQVIAFTLVAANNGPSEATGVSVQESLPSGYSLVSASTTAGSYERTTGAWKVGNLRAGQSEVLRLTAVVNATGTYANPVSISGQESDPVSSNNTLTVTPTPVTQADLAITNALDNASLNDGNAIFTITVLNNGPSAATNVSVSDLLPSGYTFVSAATNDGAYSATTGTWQIGTLPNSATAILMVSASLNAAGTYVSTATVRADENDPVGANNRDAAVPAPLSPTTPQATQRFCETTNATIADLQATGRLINWYTAPTGGEMLNPATALVNTTTYYATQTIAGYESANRLAVSVAIEPVASAGPDQTRSSSVFMLAADPGPGFWQVTSVTPSTRTAGVVIADSLVSNTTVTVPNTVTAVLRWTAAGSLCSDEVTLMNKAVDVPDVTPVIYVRPSTLYATTDITAVVNVMELNSVATRGPVIIRLTKDPMVNVTFNPGETSLNGRSVQNAKWVFDDRTDDAYYILTTTEVIPGGGELSFGLSANLIPGKTAGVITISAVIVGGTGGELRIINNTDADKIDYFER